MENFKLIRSYIQTIKENIEHSSVTLDCWIGRIEAQTNWRLDRILVRCKLLPGTGWRQLFIIESAALKISVAVINNYPRGKLTKLSQLEGI